MTRGGIFLKRKRQPHRRRVSPPSPDGTRPTPSHRRSSFKPTPTIGSTEPRLTNFSGSHST
ncbi:hypothetical protein C8Q76DRAFT_180281 [Earliella scabrosa]|nr:hypothetical protein C8Q76DRAFT_180281 [Earliella scabrosa]